MDFPDHGTGLYYTCFISVLILSQSCYNKTMKRLLSGQASENRLRNRKKRSVVFLCAVTVAVIVFVSAGSGAGEVAGAEDGRQGLATHAVAEKTPEKKKKPPPPKVIVIDPGHQKKANLSLEPVGPGSKEIFACASAVRLYRRLAAPA